MGEAVDRVATGAAAAEREAGPWIQRFARFGYAAKGAVYALIAVLALRAAFGTARPTDTRGALGTLLQQPFGRISLAAVAFGLLCYALWRIYQGARNPEDDSVPVRVGRAFTGLIHIGLAASAAGLALNDDNGSGANLSDNGAQAQDAAATALAQPLGMWLVAGVGIGFIVHALWQLYRAARAKLDDQLDLSALRAARRQWLIRAARFGMAARGVVFFVIGVFLVRAGLGYDPAEARDFGGALQELERQPYGPWLLAVVAAGLFGYGIYEFIRARYRVIRPRHALPQTTIRLSRSA